MDNPAKKNEHHEQQEAVYRKFSYRYAPDWEKRDRQIEIAKSLLEDSPAFSFQLGEYKNLRIMTLGTALALVVGINPKHACARVDWAKEYKSHAPAVAAKKLSELIDLFDSASIDVQAKNLDVLNNDGDLWKAKVKMADFVKWAVREDVQLPTGFPGAAEPLGSAGPALVAPVEVKTVESAPEPAGTVTIWTPERKAEARAYRDKHGLKKTAEYYDVSQATISKHIPAGKKQKVSPGPWDGLAKP